MLLQATENQNLYDTTELVEFFIGKVAPCLQMLNGMEFSFLNHSMLESSSDMERLVEYKKTHLSCMDELTQLFDQIITNTAYHVECDANGVTANLFNAYKIEIPNKDEPVLFVNIGNWLSSNLNQPIWHLIYLDYDKDRNTKLFITPPTSNWVFDDVLLEDKYYNIVCEKQRTSLDIEITEQAVAILGGFLKKPLLVDMRYVKAYTLLAHKNDAAYLDVEAFVSSLSGEVDHNALAQIASCIKYLHKILETNEGIINNKCYEVLDEEETSRKRFTDMYEMLSESIDQEYSQYLLMKYGTFRLCRYDQLISEPDEIEAIQYWMNDNPNKALYLLRAGATIAEIEDQNVLCYKNILAENNGGVGGLGFANKAQYRKFLKLPFNIAMLFFWLDTIRLSGDYGKQNRFFEVMFGDEATQHWDMALCWLEQASIEDKWCNYSLAHTFKSIIPLAQTYNEAGRDKIGFGLDLLYQNAKLIQAKIELKKDVREDLIGHTNIQDFLRHREARGEKYNIERLNSKTTLKSLDVKISEWIEDLNSLELKALQENPHLVKQYGHFLMKEMVVEGCTFTPITSNLELMLEGVEMDNCVYSFRDDMESDCYLVFKVVLGDERASVGYLLDEEELAVELDQVVLRSNKRVSNELFAIAKKAALILQVKFTQEV